MQEIARISITDTVADMIRKMIDAGEFKPGEKLPTESTLCDELKVSRTCVREALRVLQAMGYAEIIHGRGAFVCDPSKSNTSDDLFSAFNELMMIRNAIEPIAVSLAAKRVTARQIEELENVFSSFSEACTEHDVVRLIMLDELFHYRIAAFSGNSLLSSITKQVLSSYRYYRGKSFMDTQVFQNALEPHRKILSCIKAHDPESAINAMKQHLEITSLDMEHIINARESGADPNK